MWRQTQPATLTLRRVLGRPLAGASKSTSKDWLVVDMILEGKPSPMQCEVKAFLAARAA
ncbi:MAG TPA: hypothetical protein VN829_23840 [Dongiaceae bacterium]|nr:hypothetical protein [Dongiaceae bacterium]